MNSLPTPHPSGGQDAVQKVSGSLKAAGSLIAKQAERTKIVTVTLPRAYAELGKAVYKSSGRRSDFPELFQAIDDLFAERQKIKERAAARPKATTLADKAKRVAADAAGLATTKALDLRALQALAKLGEAIYCQPGADSGHADLIAGIAKMIACRDELDSEIAATNTGVKESWLKTKRTVVDGGKSVMAYSGTKEVNWTTFGQKAWVIVTAIIFFPPLGLVLLWRHPVLGKQRNWWIAACAWGLLWGLNVNRSGKATSPTQGRADQARNAIQDETHAASDSSSVKGRPLEMSLQGHAKDPLFAHDVDQRTKNCLRNVKGWATEGTVVVTFDTSASDWSPINDGFHLIIRLFDKNGQHLTNVISREKFTLEDRMKNWPIPLVLLEPKGNRLEYPASVRDLRDAAMAEVGLYYSRTF